MKFLYFNLMFSIFGVSLLAQQVPISVLDESRGFKIDQRCECLKFFSHCSDQQLNISGSISYFCDGSSFDYPIVDGEVCFRDGAFDHCRDKDVFICLEDANGYYEICEINECEVTVFGTLDNNPLINGQAIGLPNGISSSAFVRCQGPVVNVLNTQQSATPLLGCSGDHFFLENIGKTLANSFFSGECLNVSLFDQDGNLVNERIAATNFSGSNSIDITGNFINVDPGLYQIVFELICCNREKTNCGPNDRKSAWIDFQGEVSYDIIGTTGFFPDNSGFSPSSESNGTIYSDVSGDFFIISLHNILNNSNTQIDVSLSTTLCDENPDNDVSFQSQSYDPGVNIILVPFFMLNDEECSCYKLDVTYDDGCEEGEVTDSWFFQSGPECTDGIGAPDAPVFRRTIEVNQDKKVKLIQNPIEHQIRFEISDIRTDSDYNVQIFDLYGKLLITFQGNLKNSTIEIPFQEPTGTYFYSIVVEDDLYSGKIIKQ